MQLIELQEIYKTYFLGMVEVPVLRGLSLTISRGEYVALTGASGSGKSTLMNIIGCLDRLTSGAYFLEGEDVSAMPPDTRAKIRNSKIGFVFQNFNLLRRTSAVENVMVPLSYTEGVSDKEARERAEELLIKLGLGDRRFHEPAQLSGGQQQRCAIARALVNNPTVLLADEPTGNLDNATTDEILSMFESLNDAGMTIVVVTHESDVAARAKRIIRLNDGRLAGSEHNLSPEQTPGGVK